MITEFLGVSTREEHFVHVNELGRSQPSIRTILLQKRISKKKKNDVTDFFFAKLSKGDKNRQRTVKQMVRCAVQKLIYCLGLLPSNRASRPLTRFHSINGNTS